MGNELRNHCQIWKYALWFGVCGGISGFLLDIDHFLYPAFQGWGLVGRPLHVPMAIFAGLFAIYCCACIRRLAGK